jgi:uncharacterized protein (DUF3084 family)
MTSAYILVLAIVVLGGLIAAVGDRIGSRIGKKRMRLFNLRPKQTATLMTIVTGTLIAGSTLIVLFASSKSLRQGVFELDRLLNERRAAIKNLESQVRKTTEQKNQVEKALKTAKSEQVAVQKRLEVLNKNYQASRQRLRLVSGQLEKFRKEVTNLNNERLILTNQKIQLTSQRDQLSQQKSILSSQINQLQTTVQVRDKELATRNQQLTNQQKLLTARQARLQQLETQQKTLQVEIDRRDQRIGELDRSIVGKNLALEQREGKLKELETQMSFLRREVEVLEQYYQTYQELREKQIAIFRGQVLSFGAFRIVDPQAIVAVIDKLLREANMNAIRSTQPNQPNFDQRVVKITKAQVEQLSQQLQDGKEYVVRILSAGNYVLGETEIRVFADVVLNQKVFEEEQVLAAVSIDPQNMTEEDIQKRLDLLLASAQFRARSAGVLGAIQVEDGLLTTVVNFIDQVKKSGNSVDTIEAIAASKTNTAGPLILRLVAVKDGKIIFSTSS